MDEDDDLMAAIDAQAEQAEEARPATFSARDLAAQLRERFDHRSIVEIEAKIRDVFRGRGLYLS
jgi:hypothetical protein